MAIEYASTTWGVYLVVHPITKVPLYVGMSGSVDARGDAHKAPGSAVRAALGGLIPDIVVVARYRSQDEALDHEIKLINDNPSLLNKCNRRRTGRPLIENRDKTIEHAKPWVEAGIARRTWYAHQARARKLALDSTK